MELEDRLRSARNPKAQDKPQRITISPLDQPSPPLEFVPDDVNRQAGMPDAWCAELPWQPGAEFYRVYEWRDGYAYMRPADASAGSLNGVADTLEAAMRACGEDMVKLGRQQRWQDYMLTHEPPED